MQTHYLACDLGAESGRLIHGKIENNALELTEIHRFSNKPIRSNESIHWDIGQLFSELQSGLLIAAKNGSPYKSISCDSWGVDYLLVNQNKEIISPSFHYRDPRTSKGTQRAFEKTDWPTIFSETGIQLMPINTLFQLASEDANRLESASTILGVGDGFNFLLGGEAVVEVSMASTFQLYNPVLGNWSKRLLTDLQLPQNLFPKTVPSGSRIGMLSEKLCKQTGLEPLEIIATCSHDTGAAVAAVPSAGTKWAYLSSGTWSLMGIERAEPILSDACRELNFTNEIGYGNTIRLLKNLSGLWLLQESRRIWKQQGQEFSYGELTQLAESAAPFQSLIDPTDSRFVAPNDMIEAIRLFCTESCQPLPETPGSITRCILESLALLYRQTLIELELLTGDRIETLHIVGGGSKNRLLNQLSANATQRRVVTGPIEATAAGNILIQALALGDIENLEQARSIVKRSNHLEEYLPEETPAWVKAEARFASLRRKGTID